jgi:hypothetical protein
MPFNNSATNLITTLGSTLNINAPTGAVTNFYVGGGIIAFFSATGVFFASSGTSTAIGIVVSTPSPVSGTAFTPNANTDCTLYIPIVATTTGTVTITMGPTTGAERTPVPTSNLVALSEPTYMLRVPQGWKVIITITGITVSIGGCTAVSC